MTFVYESAASLFGAHRPITPHAMNPIHLLEVEMFYRSGEQAPREMFERLVEHVQFLHEEIEFLHGAYEDAKENVYDD